MSDAKETEPQRSGVVRVLVGLGLCLVALLLVGWLALARAGVFQRGYSAEEELAIDERFLELREQFPPQPDADLSRWLDERRARVASSTSADELEPLVTEGVELTFQSTAMTGGLAGLSVAVEALERAQAIGVEPSSIAPTKRPQPGELIRLLVADCVQLASEGEEIDFALSESAPGIEDQQVAEDAEAFLRTSVRVAALERIDALLATDGDLEKLRALPHPAPPGDISLYLASVFRSAAIWEDYYLSLMSPNDARFVEMWTELTDRWDAALE